MSLYNTANSGDETPDDQTPIKLMIHGSTGMILDANTAAERFYGIPLQALRQRELHSLDRTTAGSTPHWLRRVHDDGRRLISTVHHTAGDIPRPVDLMIHVTDVGGQPVLHITVLNTTDQQTLSQQLLTSAHHEIAERFRMAFDFSPIGIALVSPDGRWLQVNQRIPDMLGYSKDELLNSDFQSMTHPDDLDADLECVRQLLSGEVDSYLLEKRYFHRDSGIVWARIAVALVRNEANEPLYFVTQIEDITRRKQQEAAFIEQKERLELALTAAQVATWEISTETGQALIDDQWLRLLGYERGDVGPSIEDVNSLFHPDDLPEAERKFTEHIELGTPLYQVVQRALHKDGTWCWMLTAGKVVEFDQEGQPLRIMGVLISIHEQREAHRRKNELELERAHSRLLSNFIRDTSHDLRTPLTAISSSLYILERIDDRERRAEKIKGINFHVNYLNRVLEQLQTMAALDSGLILNISPVNLAVLLDTVSQRFSELAGSRNHMLQTQIQDHLPLVPLDNSRIYTALESVVLNALQFTPAGGMITIETYQQADYIQIDVHDNGIGISGEHLPFVFDRFYKVDRARPLVTGGAGLGLSMAKLIIEMHEGEIGIESTEGLGTVVTIRLPLT